MRLPWAYIGATKEGEGEGLGLGEFLPYPYPYPYPLCPYEPNYVEASA